MILKLHAARFGFAQPTFKLVVIFLPPVGQYIAEMLLRLAEQPLGEVLGTSTKTGTPPYSDLAIVIIGGRIDRILGAGSSTSSLRGSNPYAEVADELGVEERTARRYHEQYKARSLDKFND